MQSQIMERWLQNTYLEHDIEVRGERVDLPWVPYEGYMRAQLIDCVPGELGRLRIEFPADAAEDNRMHIHPVSDRVVLVVKGSGEFVAVRCGIEIRHPLKRGDRVWMPRGIRHTFFAGLEGMLVEALHNPWIPIEDPECLVYPEEG